MNNFIIHTEPQGAQRKDLVGAFCATCETEFASREQHKAHYKSDFHLFNLKRKILNLPPLTEEAFQRSYDGRIIRNCEQDQARPAGPQRASEDGLFGMSKEL